MNLDRRGEAGALNLTLTLEQAAALHHALVTGPTLAMSIGEGDPSYADTYTAGGDQGLPLDAGRVMAVRCAPTGPPR